MLDVLLWNWKMKLFAIGLSRGEDGERDNVQSTILAYSEMSQWLSLVQLMYANKIFEKNFLNYNNRIFIGSCRSPFYTIKSSREGHREGWI
jgi:hypothetical protein